MNFIYEIVKLISNLNYKRILKKLKKKDKINVVFLVSENQKWAYQSVFDELKTNDKFNLKILINFSKDLKIENREELLSKNLEFYSKIDKNAEIIFKDGKYENLTKYSPDIVFYEQQWDLVKKYKPYFVSFFALTYFSCYGIPVYDFKEDYTKKFHYYLFKYLVDFRENYLRYKKYDKNYTKNCILTGYPKLDAIFNCKNKEKDKINIIYAPHHSFGNISLRTATFDKNGQFILKLAKKYSKNVNWIFKPHPRLKRSAVLKNIMTKEEIDNYYKEWGKIGTIYDKGNYFNLFNESDLLITDCCSYLAEYHFFNKPVIWLKSTNSLELNELGKKLTRNYIKVTNISDIEENIIKVLNNEIKTQNETIKRKSGKIIVKHLTKLLDK